MTLIDITALSQKLCAKPILAELKYAGTKNFVGQVAKGYHPDAHDFALMTPKAAQALCQVQNDLIKNHALGLIIYDAYRPKRATKEWKAWSELPPADNHELERKAKHYPHINKKQLFELGYVAEDSNHCYGNTVDVVLIENKTGKKIPMGARFDFMDEISHLDATPANGKITEEAYQNRQILIKAMEKFGFESYSEEFWHFSHGGKAGREVSVPFDIEITPDLKGLLLAEI